MSWFRYLPFFFLPAALCGQQVTFATYQGGSGTESTAGIARDSAGNIYLAGTTDSHDFPSSTLSAGGGFAIKLDANGNRLAAGLLAATSITAIAVNSAGSGAIAGTIPASGLGFVASLSSTLQMGPLTMFRAAPTALAIDSGGNIYIAGSVSSGGLAATAGVFQSANNGGLDAFVMKLNADGSPGYTTYLGGSGDDVAYAIAVDSSGDVYLTGSTQSSDFPLKNAAQTQFGGVVGNFVTGTYGDAFVAKIDPKGATLLYSTYLGGASADEGDAIAVDASGNAYVAGGTESAQWLVGAATGTFQTAYAGPSPDPNNPYPDGDAFVAKFSASGSLAWYTYLGGSGYDGATAIALDNSGNIYVAGNTDSTDFPKAGSAVPDCHIGGRPFLAEFNSTGAKLLMTTGLPGMGYDQVYGMALDTAHSAVYLAGDVESEVFFATPGAAQTSFGGGDADSFVAGLNLTGLAALEVSCVLNAASFQAGNTGPFPTGAVAPGEIVSLFGVGLGPTPAAGVELTSAGTVATSIGGMTVLFDGIPAPLLYAGSGQINAVVPYGVNATTTNMTVKHGSLTMGPIPMPVVAAVPAIFMCGAGCNDQSQAAVINSNGTYNVVADPAARGDYITFYACGAGLMSSDSDGAVTPLAGPYPAPQLPVTVTIRGVNAQVLFAGAAPGYVSGLLQLNVVVPTSVDFGDHVPLSLTIGNYSSQDNVTIAIK